MMRASVARKRVNLLRPRADPPKISDSQTEKPSDITSDDQSTESGSSSSSPSQMTASAPPTSTSPPTSQPPASSSLVQPGEPPITETPAVLLNKPPQKHDSEELSMLESLASSLHDAAASANFLHYTSRDQQFADWAGKIDDSVAAVSDILAKQTTTTDSSSAMSSDAPSAALSTTTSLSPTISTSDSASSTTVIVRKQAENADDGSFKPSNGLIVGVSIAAALVLLLAALLIWKPCCRRSKDRRGQPKRPRGTPKTLSSPVVDRVPVLEKPARESPPVVSSAVMPRSFATKNAVGSRMKNVVRKLTGSEAPDPSAYAEVVDAPSVRANEIKYLPANKRGRARDSRAGATNSIENPSHDSKLANPYSTPSSMFD